MKRIVVQSEEGLSRMLNHLNRHPHFAFDWEYKGGKGQTWVHRPEIVSANFAVREGNEYQSYYVPMTHEQVNIFDEYRNYDGGVKGFLAKSKKLLQDKKKIKVCHAAEIESGVASMYGTEMGDAVRCTQIQAWLYNENKIHEGGLYPFRLKDISPIVLGREMARLKTTDKHEGLFEKNAEVNIAALPIEQAALYGTDDAINTLMLDEWFLPKLKDEQLLETYERLEIPMIRVLRDMVKNGVEIDLKECGLQNELVKNYQTGLEGQIFKEAGYVFNPRSRQQLARLLYEEKKYRLKDDKGDPLPIPMTAPSKQYPSGQYKTSDDVMGALAAQGHLIPKLMQEHGDFEKMRGTYLQKFLDSCIGGRYYPSFWQCGTVTGRYSSDFQQAPRRDKDKGLPCLCGKNHAKFWDKDELAKKPELASLHPIAVRILIVPRKGKFLIVGDYNQLELRLLAHYTQDPVLLACYIADEDLHQGTCDAVHVAAASVNMNVKFNRSDAKPLNFGLVYGLTLQALIEIFGEKLGPIVFKFLEARFAGMNRYKNAVVHQGHLDGYTRTLAFRKRRVPDINHENWSIRAHAERQLFNSLIQGSAADVVKMAQLALHRKLPEAKQILQVHDEIVFEVEGTKKQALDLAKEIKAVMQSVVTLRVPLICDPNVGTNWRSLK